MPIFRPYTGGIQPIQGIQETGNFIGQMAANSLSNFGANLAEGLKEYAKNKAEGENLDVMLQNMGPQLNSMKQMSSQLGPEFADLSEQFDSMEKAVGKYPSMSLAQKRAYVSQGAMLLNTFPQRVQLKQYVQNESYKNAILRMGAKDATAVRAGQTASAQKSIAPLDLSRPLSGQISSIEAKWREESGNLELDGFSKHVVGTLIPAYEAQLREAAKSDPVARAALEDLAKEKEKYGKKIGTGFGGFGMSTVQTSQTQPAAPTTESIEDFNKRISTSGFGGFGISKQAQPPVNVIVEGAQAEAQPSEQTYATTQPSAPSSEDINAVSQQPATVVSPDGFSPVNEMEGASGTPYTNLDVIATEPSSSDSEYNVPPPLPEGGFGRFITNNAASPENFVSGTQKGDGLTTGTGLFWKSFGRDGDLLKFYSEEFKSLNGVDAKKAMESGKSYKVPSIGAIVRRAEQSPNYSSNKVLQDAVERAKQRMIYEQPVSTKPVGQSGEQGEQGMQGEQGQQVNTQENNIESEDNELDSLSQEGAAAINEEHSARQVPTETAAKEMSPFERASISLDALTPERKAFLATLQANADTAKARLNTMFEGVNPKIWDAKKTSAFVDDVIARATKLADTDPEYKNPEKLNAWMQNEFDKPAKDVTMKLIHAYSDEGGTDDALIEKMFASRKEGGAGLTAEDMESPEIGGYGALIGNAMVSLGYEGGTAVWGKLNASEKWKIVKAARSELSGLVASEAERIAAIEKKLTAREEKIFKPFLDSSGNIKKGQEAAHAAEKLKWEKFVIKVRKAMTNRSSYSILGKLFGASRKVSMAFPKNLEEVKLTEQGAAFAKKYPALYNAWKRGGWVRIAGLSRPFAGMARLLGSVGSKILTVARIGNALVNVSTIFAAAAMSAAGVDMRGIDYDLYGEKTTDTQSARIARGSSSFGQNFSQVFRMFGEIANVGQFIDEDWGIVDSGQAADLADTIRWQSNKSNIAASKRAPEIASLTTNISTRANVLSQLKINYENNKETYKALRENPITLNANSAYSQRKESVMQYLQNLYGDNYNPATAESVYSSMFPNTEPRIISPINGVYLLQQPNGNWTQLTNPEQRPSKAGAGTGRMVGTINQLGQITPINYGGGISVSGEFKGGEAAFARYEEQVNAASEARMNIAELRGIIDTPFKSMRPDMKGRARILQLNIRDGLKALISSGNLSNQEQDMLTEAMPTVTDFWTLDSANKERLNTIEKILISKLENSSRFWGLKLQVGGISKQGEDDERKAIRLTR